MTLRLSLFGAVLGVVVTLLMPGVQAKNLQATHTVYASVTDRDGRPVLDMNASDFEVREGGTVRPVSVRLATDPIRVALIVSDRGGGQFQLGALRFCEAILGYGEISIVGPIVDLEPLTDYTRSVDTLRDGLLQLGRRAVGRRSQPGGVFLVDAILRVANQIRRDGYRAAIVVLREGGESGTSIEAETVRSALRASGAVLYVVSAISPDPGGRVTGGSMLALEIVLNDLPRESGGRHVQVVGNSVVFTMEQVASELVNRYEITYTRPAGQAPGDSISVSSTRDGVTVRAPSRIAS